MGLRLTDLDGVAQADLVRTGEISAGELVDAAIAALEHVDPVLNAVIHPRYERARAEAAAGPTGPFAGVPIVVKDLDGAQAGEPYHAGSAHLQRAGHTAGHDSHVHRRLRAAGMIVLGRTNTPELGLLPTTEPAASGPTRNPWNPGRSAGGSSGGSAAAVAARAVAIAHAGDGGGSIRIPASACGLVGLAPSRGRTSLGPEVAESWGGLVRRHVVTRSVRDTAAVLDLLHGWEAGDPYTAPTPLRPFAAEVGADPGRLRVGVLCDPANPGVEVDAECRAAAAGTAALLEEAGHHVEVLDTWIVPEPDRSAFVGHFLTAFLAFAADEVANLGRLAGRPVAAGSVESLTWALAEAGRAVTAADYLHAADELARGARRVASWWAAGGDVLVTPTMPVVPIPLGRLDATAEDPWPALTLAADLVSFTAPFNVTGQPAVSLPLHWSADGLPVGVQLVGAYGREDLLLRVAAQLEERRPWRDRVPPLHG
jgi:amidase